MARGEGQGWHRDPRGHREAARKGYDKRVRAKVIRGRNGAEVWVKAPIDKGTSRELDKKLKAQNVQSMTLDLDLEG